MPSPNDRDAARQLAVLVGAVSLLIAGAGVALVFLLTAREDAPPARPQPAPRALPVEAEPAPVQAQPAPTPLGGIQDGYGRPQPILPPTNGAAPPSSPSIPPATTTTVQVRGLNGGPEQGDLPGRYGNPYATIRLVVYNDFECPFCGRLEPTLGALHERYGDQLEVWFRDFPLAMHSHAREAHMAARCARDQERFWAMHDLLFANQRALTTEDLLGYASRLGLEGASFERCLREGHHGAAIDEDIAAGKAAGVTGTPATFVNGVMVAGARPVEAFVEIIEAGR